MGSFRKRLLVLIIGLVIVTQTVTLAAVLMSTRRTVEARAALELRSGGTLAEHLIDFRAVQLAIGVGVLAADFGFREAVASGHVPTILSAARNNAQRMGADVMLVLDTHGRVLASTVPADSGAAALPDLLDEGAGAREEPNFRVFGAHAYQLFIAPIRTPDTIAWVAMGFVVDDSLAKRIRDLVGSQVAIVTHGSGGLTRVAATPGAAAAGSAALLTVPQASDTPHIAHLAASDYLSFTRRLPGRGDSVDVILLKPLQEVLAPYLELRKAMLEIDGVALLVAAVIGALLGRSASRPIGELVRAAQRIQRGHYETTVDVSGGDEFRSLAATFNAMQSNIAAREADITYHAQHDPLTQLPNRALLKERLDSLISAARTEPDSSAALLLVDISNLRDINASLGLQVGDEVLREAARRLQQAVAAEHTLARLGETQFLVLVPGCTAERALLYAEQLAAVIRSGFHLAGVSLDLRLACAVCLFPAHGGSSDELLQRAQVALEDAHETRVGVAMYRPGRDEQHRRRLALITDLRRAIDQDQLSLVYQPKVAMATRSVRSLEALVRWQHPQLGAVSPGEFVPLAERTGGSRALTNWVLGAAIRQMGEWRRLGLGLDLAVNLSAPDILDPDLNEQILALLRAHQVDPSELLLEITESAVMRQPEVAARNMQLLRIAGIRFAIDDFGTGHSSLSQLSVLPVDELKIDRSFISPSAGSGAVTIVTSTIELAHSMGLKVVAEGVEDAAAWHLLRQLGCDFAQGYLISPPLPAAEVPAFVRQANQLLPESDSTMLQIRALDELAGRSRSGR
jgi:diguanylate cyclase (GGDEF)-like protein